MLRNFVYHTSNQNVNMIARYIISIHYVLGLLVLISSATTAFVVNKDCRRISVNLYSTSSKTEVESFKKAEFITSMSEKSGMTKKDSEAALKAVLDVIAEQVAQGKKVAITGFGTFTLRERAARTGITPLTGKEYSLAASKTPVFKASKTWKDKVNTPKTVN